MFGTSQVKSQQYEIVRVWLIKTGKDNVIIVDALSYLTICTPLPTEQKIDKYPCTTSQITLGEIDLLIGSDLYWTIRFYAQREVPLL